MDRRSDPTFDSSPEEADLLRLQSLSASLSQAAGHARRRHQRLSHAVSAGRDVEKRAARLEKSIAQLTELAEQLQPILRAVTRAGSTERRSGRSRRQSRPAGRGPGAVVASTIDLGSNSVHLLVSVVSGHRLEPLLDISEFLGLGAAVDEAGEIGPALRDRLISTLVDYVLRARTLGAARTVMVATDPLRRAADAAEVTAAIEAATGDPVEILNHDEEAFLTLLGVTAGRPVRRSLILVDIGGGSSEVLWVPSSGDPVAVGMPTGSARLTRKLVGHDPPTPAETEALLEESRRFLAGAPDAAPDDVVVVGGSATNLLRLVPAAAIDRRLTAARVREAMELLSGETAVEVATRHGLREPRARMMMAGAAIVLAVIERYGVERVRVDSNGIREGLALATVNAGPDWREHLVWLAHGWSR